MNRPYLYEVDSEQEPIPLTVEHARKKLFQYSRGNYFGGNLIYHAEQLRLHIGMSEADATTLLAYHQARLIQTLMGEMMQLHALSPPPVIKTKGNTP